MNICIVTLPKISPLNGGVENVCYNLARHIAHSAKYKVYSLYAKPDEATAELPEVTYHTLPSDYETGQLEHIDRLHQFILNEGIDILWVHTPIQKLSNLIYKASKNTGAKVVSIYHTAPTGILSEIRDRHDLYLYRCRNYKEIIPYILLLLKLPLSYLNAYRKTRNNLQNMFRNSDIVSLLSERYIDEYMRLSGINDRSKLTYVTNPLITPETFHGEFSDKKNQVLVVCRHEWKNKRLDRILTIWHKMQHSFPNWRLVILGDGPAHQEYKAQAHRLDLQRISFEGKQKPDSYYAESKIICMTSSWEGLPMVLLEAQRYGCVPIAYESFGALRDIIIPGETGYCIPPFKQGEYIQALSMLMRDGELWKTLSQNCRRHSEAFNITSVAERWIQLFQKLLLSPQK